jgi:hypothetical protein
VARSPWIEKKTWFGRPPERVYTVSEVCEILSVGRKTIYVWLAVDEPEKALIYPDEWFRLPNGHIRIREKALLRLQKVT